MEALVDNFPHIPRDVIARVFSWCNEQPDAAYLWLDEFNYDDMQEEETEIESKQEFEGISRTDVTEQETLSLNETASVANDEYEIEDASLSEAYHNGEYASNSSLYASAGMEFDTFGNRKRKRVFITSSTTKDSEMQYWVRFDDKIVRKTYLELLNISLEKTSHTSVSFLRNKARFISEDHAYDKLSCFTKYARDKNKGPKEEEEKKTQTEVSFRTLGVFRKESIQDPCIGYWTHFFDIEDIDEVWRNMVSAFIRGEKFSGVDMFEIRACSGGQSKDDPFDVQSDSHRGRGLHTIAVVFPCPKAEETIYNLGSQLMSTVITRKPIYFRPCDFDDEDGMEVFELVSKEEHFLGSEYKMVYNDPEDDNLEEKADKVGSFVNIKYSNNQIKPMYTLYSLQSVNWRPVF